MPDDVAHIPLPDRLGLIELPAAGRPSLPEAERAWMERAVTDIGRRADRVRRGIKSASEALAAFGRKDPTVSEADACVQRTFAANQYAEAKELLAAAATAHERAAKALENIAGWLKSPVGFTGGAADFRPNGKAHDLAQMDRDSVSPGGAKVEDLEVWIERAKRHIIVLVEKLGEEVGLVRLEADERFEVPPDLASEWEAKRHIIDEMARDIRTLARTLSRDSVPDDQVLKRAPEAVQGEFNQTRPHFDLETVIERLLDSHAKVRATLGPIGKVLYPEAGGKSASAERNEAAISEACRGLWLKAGEPLTAAIMEEWLKRASVPKKPLRPQEFLPEKIGLVSLRPELRLELDDDELAQWKKLKPDLERDAADLQAFVKELRADPVLARALEAAQSEFDGAGKKAKAAEVMEATRAAHAQTRRRLLAIRDWLKAPAEDGSGRTNIKARDVAGLAKTGRAPKGEVTGDDIDAWLERARALPLIELEKPKPPPEPKKEKPPEPAPPKPPPPKAVEPKPVEKAAPVETARPEPERPKPAPPEKPKKPAKPEPPKHIEPAPVSEEPKPAPKPSAKPAPKSRAGLWVGLAVVGLAAGGGLLAWKPWAGPPAKNGDTPPPPPQRAFDDVFRAEAGALSANTDPRAGQALAEARSHFDGTAEKWDESRIRKFLQDQIAAITKPAPGPGPAPFATQFAALIKRVQDEYAGGPGEAAARAAQTAAEQAYGRDAAQSAAITAEFERSLGAAKRKFDAEFSGFKQSAEEQKVGADQRWLDELAKQSAAWNAGTVDRTAVAAALTAKLKELGAPTGTAFADVWIAERPWSGGVTESDWQIRTWGKVRDQLEAKYTAIVQTNRVAQLRADADSAWTKITLHPPVASATPDEAAKMGTVFATEFETRVRQLNDARRAALEAHALGTSPQAPADPRIERDRLVAAFANAQEVLGALRAGVALDERPTGVAWTGGGTLREKLAGVLTQSDVAAANLGLEAWRGAESAADWPPKLSDLDALPPDHQRSAWRSALHRFVADATTTRGAAPEAWSALLATMSKLTTLPTGGATADAQKRDDFGRVAALLDAHQPAADHAKLLDELKSMGTLGPPPTGSPDPFPVLRANLALRKLALESKGADAPTLALLTAINDNAALAARVPDARRIHDALTTQAVNATPPAGWTVARGTLGEPSVVLQSQASGDQLGFVLLTPRDASGPRTYLAADEMSAKLFVASMNRQFPAAQRTVLERDLRELDGDLPRSWHLQDRQFVEYSRSRLPGLPCESANCVPQARRPWLALSAISESRDVTPPYPEPVPAQPGPNSPAQLISASLAKAAVEGLNLRLPTPQEWAQAFQQAKPSFANDGTGAQAFLCGNRWPLTTLNRIASSVIFNNAPGGTETPPRVLFEDVDPAATTFRHLIGNVAEVTLDGTTYRVLGGSAFATQTELGTPDKATDPKDVDADQFAADLGIRPAFNTAASRPPPVVGPGDLLVRRP